jgi:hypothetical protein
MWGNRSSTIRATALGLPLQEANQPPRKKGRAMSVTVCLSTNQTLNYPQGGGHLWVYLNWALGLRALGCEVIWLETLSNEESVRALNRRHRLELDSRAECPSDLVHEVQANVATLKRRLEPYGLAERLALYARSDEDLSEGVTKGCLDLEAAAEADLLLNLRYNFPGEAVGRFRRSAMVDIDPGLLQLWMSQGLVSVPQHDLYFTIGETVGQPGARFADLGLKWHYTPPPVYLPAWPPVQADAMAPYTTVSHWWGEEWVKIRGEYHDNNKRPAFLAYADLPSRTSTQLELALGLAPSDEEEAQLLEQRGWKIRHAWTVSSEPEQYRAYIQQSRGEFSVVKPSCVWLSNAWISDRTLCYLASAKPAVVQHTGPSRFLPDSEGLFRFRNLEEATRALCAVESDYERHCRLARELAEEHFDAQKVVGRVLERALT